MSGSAGLVSRTAAYAVDAMIVAVLTGGAAIALDLVASVAGDWAREAARIVASAYLLLLPSVMAAYCAALWSLTGRTPGMAVFGLRVVTVRGRSVRWPAALLRAVLLAWFPLGALWLLVDRRHQALHDKVARTLVVRALSSARDEVTPAGRIAG